MNPIEANKRSEYKEVQKDWGYEKWIVNDEKNNYCGKFLHLKKGEGFGRHFHLDKAETFYVGVGKVELSITDTKDRSVYKIILNEGDSYDIDRLVPHSVLALEDSTIIEFSTFHRDEDSYRI